MEHRGQKFGDFPKVRQPGSQTVNYCFNCKVLVRMEASEFPLPSGETQLYLHWLCGLRQVTSSLRTSVKLSPAGIKLAPTSYGFVRFESDYTWEVLNRKISERWLWLMGGRAGVWTRFCLVPMLSLGRYVPLFGASWPSPFPLHFEAAGFFHSKKCTLNLCPPTLWSAWSFFLHTSHSLPPPSAAWLRKWSIGC